MKNTKRIVSTILAMSMVLSMAACGEEDESSKEVSSRTSDSEVESKPDTTTTTTATESTEPVESEPEDSEWEKYSTIEFEFEGPAKLKEGSAGSGIIYEGFYSVLIDESDWKKDLTCVIGYNDDPLEYSLSDTTEWVSNSRLAIVNDLSMGSGLYYLNDDEDLMVIENQEEVEINAQKFVKVKGYFSAETRDEFIDVKMPFVGYITVFQLADPPEGDNYSKPNFCSFIATMPEDKADMDKMEEVADHAAETFTFKKDIVK